MLSNEFQYYLSKSSKLEGMNFGLIIINTNSNSITITASTTITNTITSISITPSLSFITLPTILDTILEKFYWYLSTINYQHS